MDSYDGLFVDDRVVFVGEPSAIEKDFRKLTTSGRPSPKVWADALLIAYTTGHAGKIVTFDGAFASRPDLSIVLRSQ